MTKLVHAPYEPGNWCEWHYHVIDPATGESTPLYWAPVEVVDVEYSTHGYLVTVLIDSMSPRPRKRRVWVGFDGYGYDRFDERTKAEEVPTVGRMRLRPLGDPATAPSTNE